MKKTLAAVSAAALALSTLVSPAYGMGMGMPNDDPPPPVIDDFPELSAQCVLKPNVNSDFTALAINVANSTSTVTVDDGPTVRTGNGTPVVGTTITGPAHSHGQSVNIFAFITQTLTFASATDTTPTKTTVTELTSFDCHVHKPTRGNDKDELHEGYNIVPPGLESDSVVVRGEPTVTFGTRTVLVPGPFVVTTMNNEDGVICNSPGKVPGTWRPQNGYLGQFGACSTTLYKSVGGHTPSVSVPAT